MNIDLIEAIDNVKVDSEIAVAESMIMCYSKAIDLLEYTDNDYNAFSIFQEGKIMDDVKQQGKGQSKIKKVLTFIPRLLVSLFRFITGKLKNDKNVVKQIVEKEKKMPKEAKIALVSALGLTIVGGGTVTGIAGKKVHDANKSKEATEKKFNKLKNNTDEEIERLRKKLKDKSDDLNSSESENSELKKKIDELNKLLGEYAKKNFDQATESGEKKTDIKELKKKITALINGIYAIDPTIIGKVSSLEYADFEKTRSNNPDADINNDPRFAQFSEDKINSLKKELKKINEDYNEFVKSKYFTAERKNPYTGNINYIQYDPIANKFVATYDLNAVKDIEKYIEESTKLMVDIIDATKKRTLKGDTFNDRINSLKADDQVGGNTFIAKRKMHNGTDDEKFYTFEELLTEDDKQSYLKTTDSDKLSGLIDSLNDEDFDYLEKNGYDACRYVYDFGKNINNAQNALSAYYTLRTKIIGLYSKFVDPTNYNNNTTAATLSRKDGFNVSKTDSFNANKTDGSNVNKTEKIDNRIDDNAYFEEGKELYEDFCDIAKSKCINNLKTKKNLSDKGIALIKLHAPKINEVMKQLGHRTVQTNLGKVNSVAARAAIDKYIKKAITIKDPDASFDELDKVLTFIRGNKD